MTVQIAQTLAARSAATADTAAAESARYVAMLTWRPVDVTDAADIVAALSAARMAAVTLQTAVDALRDAHVRLTGDAPYCARHDLFDCPYIATDAPDGKR